MVQPPLLPWMFALGLFSCIWLGVIAWTFRRLRLRHAATYEAIGSPDLFRNNTWRTNWLFLRFLFGGPWRALDDETLAVAIRVLRGMFVTYILGSVGLSAAFLVLGFELPR